MKVRLQETYPSAWIVKNNRSEKSKNDRGRTKIYTGNKVYLTDNSEFEIELFNPSKKSVLAKIKINGTKLSESGLVLRPGERVYLDCFIDSRRKFVFKTYEVENTKESKKAIEDNGIVEISFFNEKDEAIVINEPEMYIPSNIDWTYIDNNQGFQGFNQNGSIPSTNFPTTGTKIYNTPGTCVFTKFYSNPYSSNIGSTISSGGTFTCLNGTTTNSATFVNLNSVETGRVEKGKTSDQTFNKINMDFSSNLLNKVTYQILPEKIKPITSEDLKTKNYCGKCGKKNTDNHYCPACGNKLK